jgi:hypothetical protein
VLAQKLKQDLVMSKKYLYSFPIYFSLKAISFLQGLVLYSCVHKNTFQLVFVLCCSFVQTLELAFSTSSLPGVQKPQSSFPGAFWMLFRNYIFKYFNKYYMLCTVAVDGANCHLTHGHGEDVYVCTALLIFFNATNTINIVTHYWSFF